MGLPNRQINYKLGKGQDMKSEQYMKKAFLQAQKGDLDGAVRTFKKVIELNDDEIASIQARCCLGEYYYECQNYTLAKEYFDYILERQEKLEDEYDDLLDEEITIANELTELIEKNSLA